MGERREGEGEAATRGPASAPPLAAAARVLRWTGEVALEPPWGARGGAPNEIHHSNSYLHFRLEMKYFCKNETKWVLQPRLVYLQF